MTDTIRHSNIDYKATQNACRLCTPFGACMAFTGVAGGIPLVHGSQGCSTYIRRYLIGHFREPVDIACSNFSEETAVFGGEKNIRIALANVTNQYSPSMIGIATSCLAETIGDDLNLFLHSIRKDSGASLPPVVSVSTPSYKGSHADGFLLAVRRLVEAFAETGEKGQHVNVFSNMVSPADLRYLKEVLSDFGIDGVVVPDYSDALDGGSWESYQKLPSTGTTLEQLKQAAGAFGSIEFGSTISSDLSAGEFLAKQFGVAHYPMGLPIGIKASDIFMRTLMQASGRELPEKHRHERGRLVDAYVDGHKYLFDKRAAIYGEEDLVVAMAGFLAEIGIVPTICATGGTRGKLKQTLTETVPEMMDRIEVMENVDFCTVEARMCQSDIDIMIGNSNGSKIARELSIPLVRIGLPIHDRIGAGRVCHLGYGGTMQLFDRITNALIEHQQESNEVGYTHM